MGFDGFHLLITDLYMPGIDGQALIQYVRQHPQYAHHFDDQRPIARDRSGCLRVGGLQKARQASQQE